MADMDPLGSITNRNYAAIPQSGETGRVPEQQSGSKSGGTPASATAAGIKLPEDQVTLSGRQPADNTSAEADPAKKELKPGEKTTADGKSVEDPQVQQQISRLKQTEEKVKAHEAAHKAVGGNLASSASYSYTQGPDGRSYITGGEVQIDMSGGRTPEETISKMQQVIRAALAPADPSGQDRAVAAQAANQMAQAQQQKLQSDSPTAEPDPTQPTDPVKEAIRAAVAPTAAEDKSGPVGSKNSDSRVQQAYGNPAVQGNSSASHSSDQRQSGFSLNDTSSLISALA
jgi:hypothetical protein